MRKKNGRGSITSLPQCLLHRYRVHVEVVVSAVVEVEKVVPEEGIRRMVAYQLRTDPLVGQT